MKVVFKLCITLSLTLGTTACGWLFGDDGMFRDRSEDYRKASVEPALQIPDKLDSRALDDRYAIPQISDRTSLSEKFVVPRPEPLREVSRDSVRISILGDTRWILVDGSPGQVWPRLRGFLNLNQLSVKRADATQGILETGWLQPQGEDALRERYRLRIEQGIQRGTSEVYVLQADIRAGRDQWPDSSSDPEREKVMVQELAQYLADSQAAAAVSMLAEQAIESTGRVTLKESQQSQPYLQLRLPFPRAWASVHSALEKAGYSVEDLNRDQRTFYLKYTESKDEDEKEAGFFSRLFGGGDEQPATTRYLLHVRESDNKPETVTITIERESGEGMAQEEAKRQLKNIKIHLS